ncbi:MAG: 3-keto-5-aminohexanoate cleavage protein [Mesorhizobium sp.]
MRDIIITCAINGGSATAQDIHPDLPKTPDEIFAAVAAVAKAGAAIAHIHARDPETGMPSNDFDLFAEIASKVRAAGIDILLNLTCSMDGQVLFDDSALPRLDERTTLSPVEKRVRHALELKPEIATIDCGTVGVGESIFVARQSDLRRMASLYKGAGVKPEIECFDLSHMENARALSVEGAFAPPAFVQICLGTAYGGAPATPEAFLAMKSRMPDGAIWAAFEAGASFAVTLEAAARQGGHVRVGLEDTLKLADGSLVDNVALVAQARAIIEATGNRVADTRAARRLLSV